MANTLLTPTVIATAAAVMLVNNLVMGGLSMKQFVKEFKKIGDTVTYRKPIRYLSVDGPDITGNIQDTTEQSGTLVIDKWKSVPLEFGIKDMTLTVEKFTERYLKSAMERLANDVDAEGCKLYKDIYNAVGTAGTTPATTRILLQAGTKLNEVGVSRQNRHVVLNPDAEEGIVDAYKGIFNPAIVKQLMQEALIGRKGGFDIAGDQNIQAHTAGVPGGTPLVNGASQTGSSLVIDGMTTTTGTYKQGDIITLAGVNGVNPISKDDIGKLQQFVVTADATADGSGDATLAISPSIVTTTAYQTVTASPADDAVITLVADHVANLAFHKNAFSLVTVPIQIPDSASWKAQATHRGVSVSIIKDLDVLTYKEITRCDVMFGWKTTYPEMATRILG